MTVYFHAPLKSPLHHQPSGDRTLARGWWQAWEQAGYHCHLASTLRTWEGRGDVTMQMNLVRQAQDETARILQEIQQDKTPKPTLWFTYHLYHKAPDYIGAAISRELDIPYVVAEASVNPAQEQGAWRAGHQAVLSALSQARAVLTINPKDIPAVDAVLLPHTQHIIMPPFLAALPEGYKRPPPRKPCRLLTVAMMRPGSKLLSYTLLAQAMQRLPGGLCTLDIVGDGSERVAVEALFSTVPQQVRFHGALEGEALAEQYRTADLFVWPAINEAIGMSLLEAQAHGLPVVAGYTPGVASVVQDNVTGWLVDNPSADSLARALEQACTMPLSVADSASHAARHKAETQHSPDAIAHILRSILD